MKFALILVILLLGVLLMSCGGSAETVWTDAPPVKEKQ